MSTEEPDETREPRDEHITCIAHTHVDDERLRKAWCGRTLDAFEMHFVSIDHAAYNARGKGRLETCPGCSTAVASMLGHPVCLSEMLERWGGGREPYEMTLAIAEALGADPSEEQLNAATDIAAQHLGNAEVVGDEVEEALDGKPAEDFDVNAETARRVAELVERGR